MAKLLVSDLIEKVETELSQVVGTVTNKYGSPRILSHIEDAYIALIEEFGDETLQDFYTKTLDGTTGVIDADIVSALDNHEVNRWEDILLVWKQGENDPLKNAPPRANLNAISDGSARYLAPNITALRPFMVYPITATDTLDILARSHPVLPLTEDSYVYIDRQMIVYYTCYLYSMDDGTNPGQITKFREQLEIRTKQIKSAQNNAPIRLDPRSGSTNDRWMEAP